MKLLLDTHAFLWFIANNPRLSAKAKALLESDLELLINTASLWEIAIKTSIGKLVLAQPYDIFIRQQLEQNSIEILPVKLEHLIIVATLPFHHRDPFDRLLIAQAMSEDLSVVSADQAFDTYAVQRLW
jgi:PIN domain nuclease of toxin-antitoxin system